MNEIAFASSVEPPPSGELINYTKQLKRRLGAVPVAAQYADIDLGNDVRTHLYQEPADTPGGAMLYCAHIDVPSRVAAAYCQLDDYKKHELSAAVATAMAKRSPKNSAMLGERYSQRAVAIMEHSPLFFEPIAQSMLVGRWIGPGVRPDDRLHQRLVIEGRDSTSPQQRRLLLGGLAAFLTFLDMQNS